MCCRNGDGAPSDSSKDAVDWRNDDAVRTDSKHFRLHHRKILYPRSDRGVCADRTSWYRPFRFTGSLGTRSGMLRMGDGYMQMPGPLSIHPPKAGLLLSLVLRYFRLGGETRPSLPFAFFVILHKKEQNKTGQKEMVFKKWRSNQMTSSSTADRLISLFIFFFPGRGPNGRVQVSSQEK